MFDFVYEHDNWDWPRFQRFLPPSGLMSITAVKPPRAGDGNVVPIWKYSSSGRFTIKSAYGHISANELYVRDAKWMKVWI